MPRASLHGSVAVVALVLSCAAASAQAAPSNGPGLVTTHGHAEVAVKPTFATLSLGIEAEDQDAARAAGVAARKTDAVVGALRSAGIPDDAIRTTAYELSEQAPGFPTALPNGQMSRGGFRASTSFDVRVTPPGRAGDVLSAAVRVGANAVSVSFGSDPDPDVQNGLRGQAMRDAQASATAFAAGVGLHLGSVRSITPAGGAGFSTVRAPMPMAMSARAQRVAPGPQLVSEDVDVVWELAP